MIEWEVGRVLGSKFDKDDFPCLQVETLNGAVSLQLMHSAGFVHRPKDPEADGTACQAYYGWDNSQGYAQLSYDPRTQAILPAISPGDSLMFSSSGAFARVNADGRISWFTTDDNTTNGRTISLSLSPTSTDVGGSDGLEYNHPHCKLTFNGTGFHARHSSGARLDFGAIGGVPAPFSSLSSVAKLSAAMVHIDGSVVSLGPATGAGEPATKATSLIGLETAQMAAVTAFCSACEAAATTLESAGGTPGAVVTFAVAFQAALTTFQSGMASALGTFTPLIQSQSVLVT